MKKYIDKTALVAEIERRIDEVNQIDKASYEVGLFDAYKNILSFIDTPEVEETKEEAVSNNLEEAADNYVGHAPEIDEDLSCFTKRNAFIAGAQWQKERILNNATEREVKVDVCGYPYIDFTELYDYDKDIPLAKEGDKVKLVIVKNLNG